MASIVLEGLSEARKRTRSLPKQIRFGAMQALNQTAFAVRDRLVLGMQQAFDRPTPFVLKSMWADRATPQKLSVQIYPRSPGGKSVDPANVLRASVTGGQRKRKRFERALQSAGLLPPGLEAVPAPRIVNGPQGDGFGGVKGSFIVRLLSYLQAFGEQGYRANMTERNRKRLSGKGRWSNGRFVAEGTKAYSKAEAANAPRAFRQGGASYFVSRGPGEFTGRGSWKNGQRQHLPAGIWERSGLYDASVKPVFYFNRPATYRERFRMGELAAETAAATLPEALRTRINAAIATAR